MAVPIYYASDFFVKTLMGISDVQDWIDGIRDVLLNQLPVASRWTEPVLNTLVSPVDPATGYFMKLVLGRTAATRMQVKCIDQNNNTVQDGEADLSVGNETLRIIGGPTFLYTWSLTSGEYVFTTMVDPSPEAPNAPTVVVYYKSIRNSGGAVQAFHYWPDRWTCNDGIPGPSLWGRCSGPYWVQNSAGVPNYQLYLAGGSLYFLPAAMMMYPANAIANPRFTGHGFQLAWTDQNLGGRIQIPIDVGVVGYFEKMPLSTQGLGFTSQSGMLAVRVA